jgi:hypothetical protein
MSASKTAARLLIGFCFLACLLPQVTYAQSAQFTLTGKVDINNARTVVRLYFPKEAGRPPLLTFADSSGYFEFDNVPGGVYLIEVYVNSEMIYQKSISLNAGFRRDDSLVKLELKSGGGSSWTKVWNNLKLEQRHKVILQGDEFQGQVTVYVGDIHSSKAFSVIVFKTGDETSRWQDSSKIEERALRAMLGRDRILANARFSRNSMKTGFSYNGHYYSLDGTKLDANPNGADYLSFEIYRKP